MPHITIEHSANVADHHDISALVATVHNAALAHGLAAVTGLRTRAAERAHARVGDGSPNFAFIAIAVRVGPGRDENTKRSFIECILDAAEAQVDSEAGPLDIMWSIELNEINADFRINRNHVAATMNAASDRSGAGDDHKNGATL